MYKKAESVESVARVPCGDLPLLCSPSIGFLWNCDVSSSMKGQWNTEAPASFSTLERPFLSRETSPSQEGRWGSRTETLLCCLSVVPSLLPGNEFVLMRYPDTLEQVHVYVMASSTLITRPTVLEVEQNSRALC